MGCLIDARHGPRPHQATHCCESCIIDRNLLFCTLHSLRSTMDTELGCPPIPFSSYSRVWQYFRHRASGQYPIWVCCDSGLCPLVRGFSQACAHVLCEGHVSSHRSGVPAVLMSIVHLVQQLHLGSSKLPAQQLVCCVLLQVVLVHCLGNDCTILVETPSQQYLNQSWNPQALGHAPEAVERRVWLPCASAYSCSA